MASAFDSSYLTANKAQSILYHSNLTYKRLIDIITASASDLTVSSNMTVSETILYKTVTVNSGVTLTVSGQPGVLICKTLTNNGEIKKTPTGGVTPSQTSGHGGNGGGGLIIVTRFFDNNNLIRADGASGSKSYQCNYAHYKGSDGVTKEIYRVSTDTSGNGGNGGKVCSDAGCASWSLSGGSGGTPTYITKTASEIYWLLRKATADYYLVNVLSKSPSSTQPFLDIGGPSGGNGAHSANDTGDYCANGGGGGGAGGQIIILSDSFDNASGTIRALGGTFGSGYTKNYLGYDGTAGGDGIVYGLYYTTLVAEGTLIGTTGKTYDISP